MGVPAVNHLHNGYSSILESVKHREQPHQPQPLSSKQLLLPHGNLRVHVPICTVVPGHLRGTAGHLQIYHHPRKSEDLRLHFPESIQICQGNHPLVLFTLGLCQHLQLVRSHRSSHHRRDCRTGSAYSLPLHPNCTLQILRS